MLKVGDWVRVRKHTQEEKARYLYGWIPEMDDMEGRIYTIRRIHDERYIINDIGWNFSVSSLVPVYDQF